MSTLRSRTLWVCSLTAFTFAIAGIVTEAVDSEATGTRTTAEESVTPVEDALLDDFPMGRVVTMPGPGRVSVQYPDRYRGETSYALGAGEDKIIYLNDLSYPDPPVRIYRPKRGVKIADDLITEAIGTCDLTMLRFMVEGGGDPDDPGEFMVQAKLYDGCPNEEGTLIDGTTFTYSIDDDSAGEYYVLEMPFGDRGLCDDAGQAECSVAAQDCAVGVECLSNPQPIPPTVWLQIAFTTDTAGVVLGTPATRGYSADAYDHPFGHCTAWHGGYPYAAWWLEMYATDACPVQFLAYRAVDPNMPAYVPPGGAGTRVADDIKLVRDPQGNISCELSSYELGMRGTAGPFTMDIDLRWPIAPIKDEVVEGTHFVFEGRGEGTLEIARVEVPPGVTIGRNDQPIVMTWQASRHSTGAVLVGRIDAGESLPTYFMENAPGYPGWNVFPREGDPPPGGGLQGIFYASIYCRGEPPLGACCPDQPDEQGVDVLCYSNVPVVTCLGSRSGGGPWVQNDQPQVPLTCTADRFNPPCGVHACCKPDSSEDDLRRDECIAHCEAGGEVIDCATDSDCPGPRTCGVYQCSTDAGQTFTGRECNPDAGDAGCGTCDTSGNECLTDDNCPGSELCESVQTCELFDPNVCTAKCARWSRGELTGDTEYLCPPFECFDATGDCYTGETEVVCECDRDLCCDPGVACCDPGEPCCPPGEPCPLCPEGETCTDGRVCTRRKACAHLGCCDTVCDWNLSCCTDAWSNVCASFAANNCNIPPRNDECWGAASDKGAFAIELEDDDTGGVCSPQSASCTGVVAQAFNKFATQASSDPGFCCNNRGVNIKGTGTIWYKFVASHETARIHTCSSQTPADNSLLQVLEVDPYTEDEQTACSSLQVIACNDDADGCWDQSHQKNSDLCVTNLAVGNTYYVMLASSLGADKGTYLIKVESPCSTLPPEGGSCEMSRSIQESDTPLWFSLVDATLDCPAEENLPGMLNDIWWNYFSLCQGKLTVETCEADPAADDPATTLVLYGPYDQGEFGTLCPADRLAGFNDDADFDKHCSIGGQECFFDADCVMGCAFGPDEGNLCNTNAECSGSATCDTRPQARCTVSGAWCADEADCDVGACENSPSTTCSVSDVLLRCVSGPNAGLECTQDSYCAPSTCEPQCGWEDAGAQIRWDCIRDETCEQVECVSSCAPGSSVTVPVFSSKIYMIRLGGEFGTEPEGYITLSCEPDDCNGNFMPDLWEILNGLQEDCNFNGEPDMCDIDPTDPDVNGLVSPDCNCDGMPDECQIEWSSTAPGGPYWCFSDCEPDTDDNGVPDCCDAVPNGCPACIKCPDGTVNWLDPNQVPLGVDGIVDARQPHSVLDTTPQGWSTFDVEAPVGASTDLADGCWSVCETGGGAAPGISGVVDNADGTYTVTLDREITPGVLTTLTYTGFAPPDFFDYVGKYAFLPGDSDASRLAEATDIDYLINCINTASCEQWQTDINRSGGTNALDIIHLIDLLNGDGLYDYWIGRDVPADCL